MWIDIQNYEGLYQINKKGEVRSVDRVRFNGKYYQKFKGKILSPQKNSRGYYEVTLSKNGISNKLLVHQLVYYTFSGDSKKHNFVVDHKDENKLNNAFSNLQLISHRKNCQKSRSSSTGQTCIYKERGKYRVKIFIDGKTKHIGYFDSMGDAINAYNQLELI